MHGKVCYAFSSICATYFHFLEHIKSEVQSIKLSEKVLEKEEEKTEIRKKYFISD